MKTTLLFIFFTFIFILDFFLSLYLFNILLTLNSFIDDKKIVNICPNIFI